MTEQIALSANTRFFDVSTDSGDPLLLWVSTCPEIECMCRGATIVAAHRRAELLMRVNVVSDALHRSKDADEFREKAGRDTLVFELDIETAVPMRVFDESPLTDDRLLAVAEHIDGELLEQFGVLWQQGKGRVSPEVEAMRAVSSIDWAPGGLVAWQDAFRAVRRDIYIQDERTFEAEEFYCVAPDCDCREVVVEIYEMTALTDLLACVVTIDAAGVGRISQSPRGRKLGELLWSRFCQRHKRYRARFDARYPKMKAYGEALLAHYATQHKPQKWVPTSRKKKRR